MNLSIAAVPVMDRCGVISRHLVQYKAAFSYELVTVSVPLKADTFQLKDLHPYYNYVFTVYAENQDGYGPNLTVIQQTLAYSKFILWSTKF